MSLIKQIRYLLLGVTLLALLGAVAVNVHATRSTLSAQLRMKNYDNAQSLALVLTQQHADEVGIQLFVSSQFDTGHYERITLRSPEGRVLFDRQSPPAPTQAPAWFVSLVPINVSPGMAQVSDGWRAVGQLELRSHAGFAYDALWEASLRAAALLGAVGLLALGVATVAVKGMARALEASTAQAQALELGQFITVPEPRVPELAQLSRAMNSLVHRMQGSFKDQAEQLEALRRQTQTDPVTGLSNRRHFLAELHSGLVDRAAPLGSSLILVRVPGLDDLNRRIGHDAADQVLMAIADALREHGQAVPGCFTGRLNGSDFALLMPTAGAGHETAQAIAKTLGSQLPLHDVEAHVVLGVAELTGREALGPVLAAADSALAKAEGLGPFGVYASGASEAQLNRGGEHLWYQQITLALQEGRAHLAEFRVVTREGGLLHYECPLRVQLDPNGPYDVAGRWLALARRNRLTVPVDERALELALAAIAADGQPRCVNLAQSSLAAPGFAARLRERLSAQPQVASGLWLEVPEAMAVGHMGVMQETARLLKPLGVRLGLEHAGAALSAGARLYELGIDYIKLDARFVHSVAQDTAVQQFVRGAVNLAHAMGIQVIAEGVTEPADLEALWSLRVDGATGPVVTAP